ncbi:MAG: hypothetical protein N2513_03875 [Deltaproteobacteria bacterium]|nr:hypothetical protein [Deltaproteobacteria bacterium]
MPDLFKGYQRNGIINMSYLPCPVNRVLDAAVTIFILPGKSKDRIKNRIIDEKSTLFPEANSHPEEENGIEIPRITYVQELKKHATVYTAHLTYGPFISSLTLKENFRSFEKKGSIIPLKNGHSALFLRRFQVEWALIHRSNPSDKMLKTHKRISFGHDLKHRRKKVFVESIDSSFSDSGKIGLSPNVNNALEWNEKQRRRN